MKQKIITLQILGIFFILTLGLYAQPTFINKLPIPPLVEIPPNGTIELEMRPSFHKFNPNGTSNVLNGYPSTQPSGISTFCYNLKDSSNMTILGPTLKWRSGDSINMRVHNMLGGDTTTTHWHGAEVPALYDGGPHQYILPDTTWKTHFRILDNPSTLWYHPHLHNETLSQVQMGLSGMIIVEQPSDTISAKLPQHYGVDDIPIIMGDIGFDTTTVSGKSTIVLAGGNGKKRPYNLVNGVNSPYLDVPAHFVRLRILNGSTRKGIMFGFRTSQDSINPADSLLTFKHIATDGGYTLSPSNRKFMLTGPGERNEVLIDLSNYLGETLYLVNLKKSMPNYIVGSPFSPPGTGAGKDSTAGNAFLQLNVISDNNFLNYTPVTSFSGYAKNWESDLVDSTGAYHRPTKNLEGSNGVTGFNIDGHAYDMMRIDDIVCENTKEIWTIYNDTKIAHPFHIHKIQFRIISVLDSNNQVLSLDSLGFNGPKDDILVHPKWTVKFLGNFYDYGYDGPVTDTAMMLMNTYMYHCHILTHEDAVGGGMMRQFIVQKSSCTPSVSGTNQFMMNHNMNLFPNPSSGELYLRGHSETPTTILISDAMGRILKEQVLPPFYSDMRINTDNLPNGLLFVTWKMHHEMMTKKFFLNK